MTQQSPWPELDHPCKQTCSGWQQGFERGAAKVEALEARVRALSELEGGKEMKPLISLRKKVYLQFFQRSLST